MSGKDRKGKQCNEEVVGNGKHMKSLAFQGEGGEFWGYFGVIVFPRRTVRGKAWSGEGKSLLEQGGEKGQITNGRVDKGERPESHVSSKRSTGTELTSKALLKEDTLVKTRVARRPKGQFGQGGLKTTSEIIRRDHRANNPHDQKGKGMDLSGGTRVSGFK